MSTRDPTEPTVAELTEQSDVPVYMPGTPTLGFAAALERLASKLSR
ncbi:hypothetical protein [Natronorubrum sp. FCH18a]